MLGTEAKTKHVSLISQHHTLSVLHRLSPCLQPQGAGETQRGPLPQRALGPARARTWDSRWRPNFLCLCRTQSSSGLQSELGISVKRVWQAMYLSWSSGSRLPWTSGGGPPHQALSLSRGPCHTPAPAVTAPPPQALQRLMQRVMPWSRGSGLRAFPRQASS